MSKSVRAILFADAVDMLFYGSVGFFVLVLFGVFNTTPPEPAPVTATASPPATGRIRTWAAEGHWWVVGDGWGVHHPGCPCGAKAEVEAP